MRLLPDWRARLAMAALAAAVATPGAADELESLPEGPGREETFYTCVACHSFQLVRRQGMSRALWDDTLTFMVERHGMPKPEPEDRALILSYLAEHFPPAPPAGSGGGRRGWTNPFAN